MRPFGPDSVEVVFPEGQDGLHFHCLAKGEDLRCRIRTGGNEIDVGGRIEGTETVSCKQPERGGLHQSLSRDEKG